MKNTGLVKKTDGIPVKFEELVKYILVAPDAIKAYKAKISAIKKVGPASAAYWAALADGQNMAENFIDAEAKLGERLAAIPDKKASSGGGTRSLPDGIDKKMSHKAQTTFNNPKVTQIIAEANAG